MTQAVCPCGFPLSTVSVGLVVLFLSLGDLQNFWTKDGLLQIASRDSGI